MEITTLMYLEQQDSYLMLHRVKKQEDLNKGKWIGVGGHCEEGESPEDCVIRETFEETGLTVLNPGLRGIVTFVYENKGKLTTEYMFLYTADRFCGVLQACNEGVLAWVEKSQVPTLELWEGDRIFLRLLETEESFFSLKLRYEGDRLAEAVLNGSAMELFDIRNPDGTVTGMTRERHVAHEDGTLHGTSHVWIARRTANGFDLLLQKRSPNKDAFPGCYDISSAGHLPAGSDFLTSAVRELQEELGMTVDPAALHFMGFHEGDWNGSFYGRPFHNHEISAVYVIEADPDLSALILQPEEVSSVCWMAETEVRKAAENESPEFCIFTDELDMLEDYFSKN